MILFLLSVSLFVYIDATGASLTPHLARLFNGLPTPG